ncbi:hypothetical protein GLUCOINTEAF2_0203563 [Komagataeibacter intermedius AF2]|uniref:Uncharacterized protein n=1 Tax=Komagataeibacter intermedius AF2 TaxID=1458464 RepID=A0A0N1N3R3_9PROT|nr:hypothetical protein GLUCOINTEAF2_0203563 [Komagataeibacter intermedius AF2]
MIIADGKGHQLFQLHAILLVDIEQFVGHRHQPQALFDHGRCDKERCSDFFLGQALLQHVAKGPKLVQRMQGHPLHVLGQGIILGENGRSGLAHDARHGCRLCQFLLLHQQFKGAKTSPTGWHFIATGFDTSIIKDGADIQALQQTPALDVAGQFLDRQAGFHTPHIGLRQRQPVERDITGRTQGDFRNGGGHGETLHDGRTGDSLPPSQPVTKIPAAL